MLTAFPVSVAVTPSSTVIVLVIGLLVNLTAVFKGKTAKP